MFHFELRVEHVPGRRNVASDVLSRDSIQAFRQEFSTADREGAVISQELERLIIHETPDWLL